MATPSNRIYVPRPGRGAYNPDRPLESNSLVMAQVRHFQEAESNLPPELRAGIDRRSIETEGQASEYIRQVTKAIHKSGGRVGRYQQAT